eukprot:m51a1_g5160 hypothetical protein (741) ;mRNA; f:109041-111681
MAEQWLWGDWDDAHSWTPFTPEQNDALCRACAARDDSLASAAAAARPSRRGPASPGPAAAASPPRVACDRVAVTASHYVDLGAMLQYRYDDPARSRPVVRTFGEATALAEWMPDKSFGLRRGEVVRVLERGLGGKVLVMHSSGARGLVPSVLLAFSGADDDATTSTLGTVAALRQHVVGLLSDRRDLVALALSFPALLGVPCIARLGDLGSSLADRINFCASPAFPGLPASPAELVPPWAAAPDSRDAGERYCVLAMANHLVGACQLGGSPSDVVVLSSRPFSLFSRLDRLRSSSERLHSEVVGAIEWALSESTGRCCKVVPGGYAFVPVAAPERDPGELFASACECGLGEVLRALQWSPREAPAQLQRRCLLTACAAGFDDVVSALGAQPYGLAGLAGELRLLSVACLLGHAGVIDALSRAPYRMGREEARACDCEALRAACSRYNSLAIALLMRPPYALYSPAAPASAPGPAPEANKNDALAEARQKALEAEREAERLSWVVGRLSDVNSSLCEAAGLRPVLDCDARKLRASSSADLEPLFDAALARAKQELGKPCDDVAPSPAAALELEAERKDREIAGLRQAVASLRAQAAEQSRVCEKLEFSYAQLKKSEQMFRALQASSERRLCELGQKLRAALGQSERARSLEKKFAQALAECQRLRRLVLPEAVVSVARHTAQLESEPGGITAASEIRQLRLQLEMERQRAAAAEERLRAATQAQPRVPSPAQQQSQQQAAK